MKLSDRIRALLVGLLPQAIAGWLWSQEWIPLGRWAPHVLGRSFGGNVTWGRIDKP